MAGSPFASLRQIAQDAVQDAVVPGLVIAVGAGGQTRLLEAFGSRQIDPLPAPATTDTIYDVASLTKALVTSLLVMHGIEKGVIGLDQPALVDSRPEITVRRLLAHAAGFPAHRPHYERVAHCAGTAQARIELVALAAAEPAQYPPGSRSLYSDIGFILLGDLLERLFGARLDVLAAQILFAPLGLANTGFRPLANRGPDRACVVPIAPTERCAIRGRLLVGEVHDLNAFAMEGVSGHAGLFAPAGEMATMAHALCAAWRDSGIVAGRAPLVGRDVLRAFWRPSGVPGSTWRLGWDGPSAQGSLAGDRFSRTAVGHLAFTGCSLWIDPQHETFVLVLANRVHPMVIDDPRFRTLRRALNDAALEGLPYTASVSV